MLYSNKNIEELENLNELVSLNNQVRAVRWQDEPGHENFREDIKKVFEPVADTIKNTSEDLTKTMVLSSERKT